MFTREIQMGKHFRLYEIYNTIKLGWDRTSFLFYIGTPAAIIGKFFGAAGVLAVIVTVLFLYGAGSFHTKYESSKKKKGGKSKKAKSNKKNLLITLW